MKSKKKLELNEETVRQLTESEAQTVNGGGGAQPTCTAVNSLNRSHQCCTAIFSLCGTRHSRRTTTAINC